PPSTSSSLLVLPRFCVLSFLFFYNAPATTEIYALSLHDALPILNLCMSWMSPLQGCTSKTSANFWWCSIGWWKKAIRRLPSNIIWMSLNPLTGLLIWDHKAVLVVATLLPRVHRSKLHI